MKRIILLVLLSHIFHSCIKEEPYLTLSESQISVLADGATFNVTVSSNNSWTATSSDWCYVSPSSGEAGETSISINVLTNTKYDSREYTIKFSSLEVEQNLTITQSESTGIIVHNNVYELSSETQEISVEVQANVEYDISIDSDWITQKGTKALASNTYLFEVAENDTYGARSSVITIDEKNGDCFQTIIVRQVQNDAIIISSKEYNLSNDAQSLDIKLQTNIDDISVEISEDGKSWVTCSETKALSDKNVVFNISANDNFDARNCEIIIKKQDNSLADTIQITQAQKDAIIISQKEYELSCEEHTLEVELQTNVDIEVVIPDTVKSWIDHIETKALVDKILVLKVKENDSYGLRTGEIIVKKSNESYADTIIITQEQNDALIISKKVYELSSDEHTLEVKLKSNVDFEFIIPEADQKWISYAQTKALSDTIIYLNIAKNEKYKSRESAIYVKYLTSKQDTIRIIQQQKDTIIFNKTEFNLTALSQEMTISVMTNMKYLVDIPSNASNWLSIIESDTISTEANGLNRERLKFLLEKNDGESRSASVLFNDANGNLLKEIQISQEGTVIVNIENPGTLSEKLSFYDISKIYSLKVTGIMNDVDFIYLRNIKNLKVLNLYDVNITSLPANAFYEYRNKLHELYLPKTLTSIGETSFYRSNLQTVYISYNVERIEDSAFKESSLQNIVFEDNSNLVSIGESAFERCENLLSVDLPANLEVIHPSAFIGCTSLIHVDFSQNSKLNTIDESAFALCSSLESINIPSNVIKIGSSAFRECKSLSILTFSDNSQLEIIGGGYDNENAYGAFYGCVKLTTINIPSSVVSIEASAFKDCKSLSILTFGENSKLEIIGGGYDKLNYLDNEIAYGAFAGCESLTAIIIPSNVRTIGAAAFQGCKLLQTVVFEDNSKLELIEGPEESFLIEYYDSPNDNCFLGAFSGCVKLSSINLPSSLLGIGGYAFSGCSSLSSIFIPAGVEDIGLGAFYNCTNLSTVSFEKSSKLKELKGEVKAKYDSPYQVLSMGVFGGCTSLASIRIPAEVECIAVGAFSRCYSLKTISFEENSKLQSIPHIVLHYRYDYTLSIGVFQDLNISLVDMTNCSELKEISGYTFGNNKYLAIFKLGSIIPPTISDRFYGIPAYAALKVPSESVDAYKLSDWGNFFSQISSLED